MLLHYISAGLSKFARLARSVTRNRSVLMQFSSHVPNTKVDSSKPSQIANVSSHIHTGGNDICKIEFKLVNYSEVFEQHSSNNSSIKTKHAINLQKYCEAV